MVLIRRRPVSLHRSKYRYQKANELWEEAGRNQTSKNILLPLAATDDKIAKAMLKSLAESALVRYQRNRIGILSPVLDANICVRSE